MFELINMFKPICEIEVGTVEPKQPIKRNKLTSHHLM